MASAELVDYLHVIGNPGPVARMEFLSPSPPQASLDHTIEFDYDNSCIPITQ